ncbi:hypothetical protein HELRODRAFT_184061 [Helobdella robusta]|uniref:Uncharacterized protein n=1 Tax=Helobdella robusta TaxID=6412 RepID=T1FKI4_HELRO|nr:hypothetical protein HELRODRAFT_184061 [Helobdella robusta]ESO08302.1 hypothetical protein HELRODRAFT_184061 [Helobdella robusta]
MGRAYENLVEHTERRECLERMVRMKLESEVVRLNEDNRDFKDQLHQCLSQLHQLNDSMTSLNASSSLSSPAASPLTSSLELQQKELQKKDVVLMKLLKQNRCLLNAKNELEYEASLLRGSLEEQKKQMTFMQLSLSRLQQQQFLNEPHQQHKQHHHTLVFMFVIENTCTNTPDQTASHTNAINKSSNRG